MSLTGDAQFPGEVWDGRSLRRPAGSDRPPDKHDWDEIVKEVQAIQSQFNGSAITGLTDSTGGATDGTLEAVPSDTLVNAAAASNNNFAEVNAKLDAILAALQSANLIQT